MVKVAKLALELDQRVIIAGDVAGAAGTGTHAGRGLDHGADHFRVLAHAKIVVRAPDYDRARSGRGMPDRMRKPASDTLQIGEHAIALLAAQPAERIGEKGLVVDPGIPTIIHA